MTITLKSLFRKDADGAAVQAVYRVIVAQAREPAFYGAAGVPDTATGRFAMVALHGFLAMDRLGREPEARKFSQDLFDLMFADMDRNLREMGVGDLGVGRKVRDMVSAFYGRAEAYEKALQGADKNPDDATDGLAAALRRNLYRDASPDDQQVQKMAGYVQKLVKLLSEQSGEAFLRGDIRFNPTPF